jgi:hypothetical protein
MIAAAVGPGWWALCVLFGLGAYHGLNPGMGWLFAVSLGFQEKSGLAVVRAIPPLALGHLLSMGAVVLVVTLLQMGGSYTFVRIAAAGALIAVGIAKLASSRHPRWARWRGMRVGFRDLTIWSFLMASAHGAGLMLLPVVLAASPAHGGHAHHMAAVPGPWTVAVVIHTLGYLAATAAIGIVVYRYIGLAFLRRAWINLDLLWSAALIVSGMIMLVIAIQAAR